ncbi:Putative RNA polymerase II subunit B1 CTD phosphatase RPAP2 homolog [Linum grandiflorum]
MSREQSTYVAKAVYKLQLALYAGIQTESQLIAAGSLMSQGDYADVVTERSYINHCGHPLCNNKLPSERPRKGHYRISLKEHKVYDLHETYMYCSSTCLVNSRAFAGILQEQRSLVQSPAKLAEILRLYDTSGLESAEAAWKNPDLGMSKLAIQEKGEIKAGEVPPVGNAGSCNAIEGYVPRRDGKSKPSSPAIVAGRKAQNAKSGAEKHSFVHDLDFTSTIIMSDEYSVSKSPATLQTSNSEVSDKDGEGTSGKVNVQSSSSTKPISGKKPRKVKASKSKEVKTSNSEVSDKDGEGTSGKLNAQSSSSTEPSSGKKPRKVKASKSKAVKTHGMSLQDVASPSNPQTTSSLNNGGAGEASEAGEASNVGQSRLKPSLKSSCSKKLGRSVTWADENAGSSESNVLCNVSELKDDCPGDDEDKLLLESAEACAKALSQAAEAVASGQVDTADAMSELGLIILPQANNIDQNDLTDDDNTEQEDLGTIQWPGKPGIPPSDMFDPDESWFDGPPEGFSLELSPFATMWMALFEWVTSSSLAYIYGKDDSSHEDYLSVNGREYPRKIVSADGGHSSEIKQTVESCLARALPAVVADLRLPIPVSTLEQGVVRLSNTMTFMNAIPAFRTKQWQVVVILLMEALSICRIPSLSCHINNRRAVLRVQQVLEGARIGRDEYAMMKELMMPLGRVPGFASQSGA